MKKKTIITGITALVLALSMSVGMAAHAPREAVLAPSPNGWYSYICTDEGSEADGAEAELARRGTIETVIKSVADPTPANPKAVTRTSYGTVDYSTAAQGCVSFTANGKSRAFILYAPDSSKAYFTVARGDTIQAALAGGDGTYKFAIATREADGYDYVDYKGSFRVTLDSDLAPYLISTPYGDYADAPETAKQAEGLWDASKSNQDNVSKLARRVADTLDYDKSAKTGAVDEYVGPDTVLAKGEGVCVEHSVLLTAMLCSRGVPACYAGDSRHAWVRAWVELSSWTSRGVTYSKGAWVTIEATSGSVLWPPVKRRTTTRPTPINGPIIAKAAPVHVRTGSHLYFSTGPIKRTERTAGWSPDGYCDGRQPVMKDTASACIRMGLRVNTGHVSHHACNSIRE